MSQIDQFQQRQKASRTRAEAAIRRSAEVEGCFRDLPARSEAAPSTLCLNSPETNARLVAIFVLREMPPAGVELRRSLRVTDPWHGPGQEIQYDEKRTAVPGRPMRWLPALEKLPPPLASSRKIIDPANQPTPNSPANRSATATGRATLVCMGRH